MKTISFSGSSRNKTIIIVGLLAFGAKTGLNCNDFFSSIDLAKATNILMLEEI